MLETTLARVPRCLNTLRPPMLLLLVSKPFLLGKGCVHFSSRYRA